VPASILTPAPVPPAPAPVPPAPVPPGSIIAPGPSTQRPTGPPVIQTAPPTADPSRSGEPERSTPPTPEAATELQRYRRAHEAHFHGSDPAAALAAWDAYLASYPNGQLAIEAQFSRALVLIKLERWTDAAAALRPFASAPPGSYRQAEAARLIEAIPGH
jgi:TolA-binding protein